MRHILRRQALLLATFGLWPWALPAQPAATRIWRCDNQYSDRPCQGGTTVAPAAGPDAEERAAADAATRRIREQADALSRERTRREAAAAGQPPALIAHPARAQDADSENTPPKAKRPRQQKGRKPQADHFTARGAAASR